MAELANDLGLWYERFVRELQDESFRVEGNGEWRRIERRHIDDAALELASIVDEHLTAPVRRVVMFRAAGMKWREIREREKRPMFSLKDDWARGIRVIADRAAPIVARLS